MFRLTLSAVFLISSIGPVQSTAFAEEAVSAEGSAESSVSSAEGTSQVIGDNPFLINIVGAEAFAYLLTTAGVLLTVGGTIMYINKRTELKRRYRDAAAEATHLKTDHPQNPLAFADQGGSLVKMISLERATARQSGFAIDRLSPDQLTDLVILRSKLLEAK